MENIDCGFGKKFCVSYSLGLFRSNVATVVGDNIGNIGNTCERVGVFEKGICVKFLKNISSHIFLFN